MNEKQLDDFGILLADARAENERAREWLDRWLLGLFLAGVAILYWITKG